MTHDADAPELSWYDITIAGKRFNISSRHGEDHIRRVERLLGETMAEVEGRLQGQNPLNVALLTALNLADQLLLLQSEQQQVSRDAEERLEELLRRLKSVLAESDPNATNVEDGHACGAR